MTKQWVRAFRDGHAGERDLLGGKGANLAEMTRIGLPVPPGFTITTDAFRAYQESGEATRWIVGRNTGGANRGGADDRPAVWRSRLPAARFGPFRRAQIRCRE